VIVEPLRPGSSSRRHVTSGESVDLRSPLLGSALGTPSQNPRGSELGTSLVNSPGDALDVLPALSGNSSSAFASLTLGGSTFSAVPPRGAFDALPHLSVTSTGASPLSGASSDALPPLSGVSSADVPNPPSSDVHLAFRASSSRSVGEPADKFDDPSGRTSSLFSRPQGSFNVDIVSLNAAKDSSYDEFSSPLAGTFSSETDFPTPFTELPSTNSLEGSPGLVSFTALACSRSDRGCGPSAGSFSSQADFSTPFAKLPPNNSLESAPGLVAFTAPTHSSSDYAGPSTGSFSSQPDFSTPFTKLPSTNSLENTNGLGMFTAPMHCSSDFANPSTKTFSSQVVGSTLQDSWKPQLTATGSFRASGNAVDFSTRLAKLSADTSVNEQSEFLAHSSFDAPTTFGSGRTSPMTPQAFTSSSYAVDPSSSASHSLWEAGNMDSGGGGRMLPSVRGSSPSSEARLPVDHFASGVCSDLLHADVPGSSPGFHSSDQRQWTNRPLKAAVHAASLPSWLSSNMTVSQDLFSSASGQPRMSVDHFATNSPNGFGNIVTSGSSWTLDDTEVPSACFRDTESRASVTGDGHRGIQQLLRGMGADTAGAGFNNTHTSTGSVADSDFAPLGDAAETWMRFQAMKDSSASERLVGDTINSTIIDDSIQGAGTRTGLVNFDDRGSVAFEGPQHASGMERSGVDALHSTNSELELESVLPGSRGNASGLVDLSEQSDRSSISRVVLPALAASLFSQPRKVRDAEVHCRLEESSLNCSSTMPRPRAPTSPQASHQVKDWGGQTVLEDGQKPSTRHSESSSPGSHSSGRSCQLPPMTRLGAIGKVPTSPGRPQAHTRRTGGPASNPGTAGMAKPPWRAGTTTARKCEGGARLKPTGQALEATRRLVKGTPGGSRN